MTYIPTGGNQPIQTGPKQPKNHDPKELGQKSIANNDNDTPDVYYMECENPSVGDISKNHMPLETKIDEESES